MILVAIAWRNFRRNIARYRILHAALIVISVFLVAVIGALFGLNRSVHTKASRYFAGDLVVLGFDGSGRSEIVELEKIAAGFMNFTETGVPVRGYSRRSTYYEPEKIELYYIGYSIRQRRLVGVEWDLERTIMNDFDFLEGGVPPAGDEKAVIISSATSKHLGIAVGEELTIAIESERGRINTGNYIVHGIYHENSFFGFTTYMYRTSLNTLKEVPTHTLNEMGVFLAGHNRDRVATSHILTRMLENFDLPTFPPLMERQQYREAASTIRNQREYGVVTLDAQLDEITDLLKALSWIALSIVVSFLGILIVGVSNTYTMVVWERTKEIGTLRAMGMERSKTFLLFILEAGFLGGTAALFGIGFGIGALMVIERSVFFPPNAFTTLFLTAGRLAWEMPLWTVPTITALMVTASVLGAGRAAIRAGKVHPVQAMRQEA